MKEEKKITQSDIDRAEVKLHPILGVGPRTYLPVAYACLALLLLFLLLFLPGMRKFGSRLVFDGAPLDSAVYVDNAFRGHTGQKIFLQAGDYTIKIEHSGFVSEEKTLKVGGRLFGSLFFPKKLKVDYALKAEKPLALLRDAFRDYSSWSLTGKPSALYQIPPVLSEAAGALAGTSALQTGAVFEKTPGAATGSAFAADALSMTASAEAGRDALRAGTIVVTNGMPGPLSLVSAARSFTAMLASGKEGAVWLLDVLPKKTTHYQASLSAIAKTDSPGTVSGLRSGGSLSLGGHDFILFSGGQVSLGGEAPSGSMASYSVRIPAFGIAKTEVTNRQWARFLAENPKWKPENRAALIEEGLADDEYLKTWTGSPDEHPVTNVSWHAAQAYCEWATSKAQARYRVILPSEAMWEAAARAGLSDASSGSGAKAVWADPSRTGPSAVASAGYAGTGLADMLGNVWEWTGDSYRPYPAFAANQFSGDEKAVRGGSWGNSAESVSVFSRGGVVSSHSSAFLGFRPAIVEK